MKKGTSSVFSDGKSQQALLALFLIGLLFVEPLVAKAGLPANDNKKNIKIAKMKPAQRVEHVLSRLSFGARPEDFERVKEIGVEAYIEEQLKPEDIDDQALDARLAKLSTLSLAMPALISKYNPPKPPPPPAPSPFPSPTPNAAAQPPVMSKSGEASSKTNTPMPAEAKAEMKPVDAAKNAPPQAPAQPTKPASVTSNPQQVVTELQRAKLLRATYSKRQLNEVIVDFWENHFSIYAQKDADRWLLTGFDREAIRPNALGRFRDLLGATAKSPAMLFYLDNWQSGVLHKYPAANGKPARETGGINENYARELMELHTLGVDGGYTQKDVQEIARCFTGWTIYRPNESGLFMFNPAMHDAGEKTVLGQKIPAGGGLSDGERVLDILAKQPATAHFIATKLARRFIGDNPPAAVVNQAAKVFLQTDGSIRETLRSILTSPEFFAPPAYRAKVRSPFEYAVASLRLLGAETDGDRPLLDWIGRMGEPTFGKITPDGFPEVSSEWLSTNDLLARFNFANALVTNKIKGTRVDVGKILPTVDLNDPQAVTKELVQLAFVNNITAQTQAVLDKSVESAVLKTGAAKPSPLSKDAATVADSASKPKPENPAGNSQKLPDYLGEIMTLVIGSREFQTR